MGKMIIGPKRSLVQGSTVSPNMSGRLSDSELNQSAGIVGQILEMQRLAALVESRTAQTEVVTPTTIVEKTVEKVETRTEVSVITKDKRARQYTKAVRELVNRKAIILNAVARIQDTHAEEIKALQQLVAKQEARISDIDSREKAIEAAIPEENQVVKQETPTMLYLAVGASLLMSLVSLIIK